MVSACATTALTHRCRTALECETSNMRAKPKSPRTNLLYAESEATPVGESRNERQEELGDGERKKEYMEESEEVGDGAGRILPLAKELRILLRDGRRLVAATRLSLLVDTRRRAHVGSSLDSRLDTCTGSLPPDPLRPPSVESETESRPLTDTDVISPISTAPSAACSARAEGAASGGRWRGRWGGGRVGRWVRTEEWTDGDAELGNGCFVMNCGRSQ